jgi:hypothetical protein
LQQYKGCKSDAAAGGVAEDIGALVASSILEYLYNLMPQWLKANGPATLVKFG